MTSTPSNAIPVMLRWTREKAGLTPEDAVKNQNFTAEQLIQWEQGEGTPSLPRLEKLARLYRRPTHVFYLPEPPAEFNVTKLKDFRALRPGIPHAFSPALRFAIRRAQELQQWAASTLEDDLTPRVDLAGSVNRPRQEKKTARELRDQLDVTIEEQGGCKTTYAAFGMWRSRCEDLGIFVFQIPGVDLDEMRGFSLPHKLTPVIVINSADVAPAKLFTLIHEVGHILLGMAAVTGSEHEFVPDPGRRSEEFCNKLAAEVLVPENDFVSQVPTDWIARDNDIIRALADRYHVSRAMIAFRLVETGFADRSYFFEKLRLFQQKRTKGGPARPVSEKVANRWGGTFCRLVASSFQLGRIHGGEVTSLLGMSLKHLSALESLLYPQRVTS